MERVKPIFKDDKYQHDFEQNGFVTLPMLNNVQVDELNSFFASTQKQHETVANLHHTTTDTENIELINLVDKKIKSIFLPELDKVLCNFKALVGCFNIKETGSGSATGTHQDPTFVDELKYTSANVWVALQDIDKNNGSLYFIAGSNHAVSSLRVVPQFPPYYQSFHDSLLQMATHVPLKKGEAVIFNNSVIHGATENLSNHIRLAATLLVCSEQAEWLLYYKEKNAPTDRVEKYHLNLDTFISMPKGGRPNMQMFQEYLTYDFPQITKRDFIERTNKNSVNVLSYFQKIKKFISIRTI